MTMIASAALRNHFLGELQAIAPRYALAEVTFFRRDLAFRRSALGDTTARLLLAQARWQATRLGERMTEAARQLGKQGLSQEASGLVWEALDSLADGRARVILEEQASGRFVPNIEFAFQP